MQYVYVSYTLILWLVARSNGMYFKYYKRIHMKTYLYILISALLYVSSPVAQNSALSSHLHPNDNFDGDIRIKEVRVPLKGFTPHTYWCALGWFRGAAGVSGYGGMQYHHTLGTSYIYSIWNDFAVVDYKDEKTTATIFGGEGTGVKSSTYGYPWVPDNWYVMADRTWGEGDNTYFAFIIRDAESSLWHHVITWKVPVKGIRFSGASYNFIEDWSDSGENYRESHIRRGWKRKVSDESWFAAGSHRYYIVTSDIEPGKRSYNYRNNWVGGIAKDDTGDYLYMGTGGSVQNVGNDNTWLDLPRSETSPQETYGTGSIVSLSTKALSDSEIEVSWGMDQTAVPQFSYSLSVEEEGAVLLVKSDTVPQKRIDTLSITGLEPGTKSYTVTLAVRDFFDGVVSPKSVQFGKSSDSQSGESSGTQSGDSSDDQSSQSSSSQPRESSSDTLHDSSNNQLSSSVRVGLSSDAGESNSDVAEGGSATASINYTGAGDLKVEFGNDLVIRMDGSNNREIKLFTVHGKLTHHVVVGHQTEVVISRNSIRENVVLLMVESGDDTRFQHVQILTK